MSVAATVEPATVEPASDLTPGPQADPAVPEPALELDLLVADVSIDGMCGVY